MSLLVFNSANSIAQGVIRRLYRSGAYERIVCADIYPNYYAIQRFLNFKGELKNENSNTKITDIKISERSELINAVQSASHVVYITHDYYSLVPSKLNLIKTVAELAKKHKNVQRLVALTPIEHDHYEETNPVEAARTSEKEAAQIYPNLVTLKSDITFGPNSTLSDYWITSLLNGYRLSSFKESGLTTQPIHSDNVAEIVENSLKDDSRQGKAYYLQGKESVTPDEYITALEDFTGRKRNESGSDIISQIKRSITVEDVFKHYKAQPRGELEGIESFGLSLNSFKSAYPQNGLQPSTFASRLDENESYVERKIQQFLY